MTDEMVPSGPTAPWSPSGRPSVALWLGHAAPRRTIRWLDGALAAAAALGPAVAIAAGDPTWLDLANDRAVRAGLTCAGVATDLQLDYLGWAQVAAAAARSLGASTVLVDEASRPERAAEVAAIAELLDAAQLTQVVHVALAPAGDARALQVRRRAGQTVQTLAASAPIVLGVCVAGPALEDYPTPIPSAALRRLDLPALGLDPSVLAHRALPPHGPASPHGSVARVADLLAAHLRSPRPPAGTSGT